MWLLAYYKDQCTAAAVVNALLLLLSMSIKQRAKERERERERGGVGGTRSRMIIDPRTPAMPGRSTSDQADIALTKREAP